MIKVSQLTKKFGQFVAVNDLSFTVAPGEVLGFLGPNGAGKSTTMKMVTGFLSPTSGSIEVCGYDMGKDALAAKKKIGYLPEGAPCYGDMTCREFLSFIAQVRGFRGQEAKQRIEDVVKKLELGAVLHKPIDTLSKGFKRRVGLAQAIIHDPTVLILDEPTDGLDPNQKQQVRDLITNLSKEKIVIVSTHILEEVSAVCSRAMIISNGRLLADGTPSELEARSRYHGAVTISLSGASNAEQVLSAVPGVSDVEVLDTEGQQLTLVPKEGCEIYSDVLTVLHEKAWKVNEMVVEKGRLDEVFRSITGGAA